MQAFIRKNLVTILILGATLVLAGIAVFTAIRLYQLRQQPVAPTAPTSKPAAAETPTPAPSTCNLTFSIALATGTPTPTPTGTATPTPTPGTPNACGGTCGSDTNCQSGMVCYITSGTTGICRNPSCLTSTNCACATPTPTPIALATPTPTPIPAVAATPAPQLPKAGVSTPTWIGIGIGSFLLIGAVLLAL